MPQIIISFTLIAVVVCLTAIAFDVFRFGSWQEEDLPTKPSIDPRSPTGRYLAGAIGIAELEALIGASVGVKSDLKLVEELDSPISRLDAWSQDVMIQRVKNAMSLDDFQSAVSDATPKPVDIVISAEGVSVVMLEGDHRTIQPLDTMTCAQLDSIAKWLEIPNSEVMLKSELLSRISAELGFRS